MTRAILILTVILGLAACDDAEAPVSRAKAAPPPTPMDAGSAASGAVPQSGGLRRIVLIAVALGLAWAALRLSGVV